LEPTAEELLRKFQKVLLDKAQAVPTAAGALSTSTERLSNTERQAVRRVEQAYGPMATQVGRRLQELLTGSYAWDLFERARPRRSRLPKLHELSRCEPLILLMRESGELAERERLLTDRDSRLTEIWRDSGLSELDRQTAAHSFEEQYRADIARSAEFYRPFYHRLRRATGAIPPLTGPRVRSRPLLQPPIVAHFFGACHAEKEIAFEPIEGGYTFAQGRNSVTISGIDAEHSLTTLDEMAWDIAAIAVSAFFVRTAGNDPSAEFPLLIDDYFEWRGVDPRKRTIDLRKQIDARIRLLFSDSVRLHSEMDLWLADSQTNRRKKTPIVSDGAFLVRRTGLYRLSAWQSEIEHQPLYGYMVSLGPWAERYIEERAMIGIFPKRLTEYDLRREQWERRIGWYITFQMHNQGSRMVFEDIVGDDGEANVRVTPQHPLIMRTVLANAQVRWEEMARTNPGKVIKQWIDALETLGRDGVIGEYTCLDGAPDGSDLPSRSRLATMLEYRYQFTPGADLLKHIRAKSERRRRQKPSQAAA
jgi:hypothetical protein